MAWMFSVVSSDPALQKFTSLDRPKRDLIATNAGAVFQRLIVVECRGEAVAAIKAEGRGSFAKSFGALGEAAVNQMFNSPQAQQELKSLDKGFDKEKLKALGREAGIAEDQAEK
ncbi:MAG TPA: hypothetical protein VJT70_08430 [Sphingomicrobium sp.]|nr:hypothetical protein [Sphingomicrobium sp.]